MTNVWCKEPFIHTDIVVENNHVYYKPCNVYEENFSTPNFNNVQKCLSDGRWAPGCNYCKKQEDAGGISRRIGINKLYKDKNIFDGLQGFSLRYGTLCNSTCVICDETRSSAWASKLLMAGHSVNEKFIFKKSLLPDLKTLLKDIDTSKITHIDFHGGEPLLNSYPWDTLELCDLSNLSIKINTNGTVWPNSMIEFKKCKSTEIIFSIDDINDRLEFLRPPAKFGDVVNNIQNSKAMGFKTSCTYTLSSLNIYYLPEFLLWGLKNFGVNLYGQHLFGDSKFNLYNLNDYAKNKILEKFETFPKLKKLTSIAINEMMKPIVNTDEALMDVIKNPLYQKTFPEWYNILTHA